MRSNSASVRRHYKFVSYIFFILYNAFNEFMFFMLFYAALSKTFSVKKKKGKLRKAWDGSKVIYNVASWGATAIGYVISANNHYISY